jgi:hypothetical protein
MNWLIDSSGRWADRLVAPLVGSALSGAPILAISLSLPSFADVTALALTSIAASPIRSLTDLLVRHSHTPTRDSQRAGVDGLQKGSAGFISQHPPNLRRHVSLVNAQGHEFADSEVFEDMEPEATSRHIEDGYLGLDAIGVDDDRGLSNIDPRRAFGDSRRPHRCSPLMRS